MSMLRDVDNKKMDGRSHEHSLIFANQLGYCIEYKYTQAQT